MFENTNNQAKQPNKIILEQKQPDFTFFLVTL